MWFLNFNKIQERCFLGRCLFSLVGVRWSRTGRAQPHPPSAHGRDNWHLHVGCGHQLAPWFGVALFL